MALELTEGQVAQGYIATNLGEITTKIGSGATPRGGSKVYVDEGATFIRSQNVLDNSLDLSDAVKIDETAQYQLRSVEVKQNDVLINITGDSIARCAQVKFLMGSAFVNQHVSILRCKPELVNPAYLQKCLVAPRYKKELLNLSDGGTRKALTKGNLESFEIVLPSLTEQNRIAEILGSLDDKIEANNALIESLESLADLRIEQAKEDGAPIVKISDLAIQRRNQILPSKVAAEPVLHYSLPAFDNGGVPAEETPESILSNKYVIDRAVVLFSKLNPRTPRIWMVEPDRSRPNFASTEFVVLEPREGIELGSLWAACRDPKVSRTLEEYSRGTSSSHQRVSPQDILDSEVVKTEVPAEETKLIRDLIAENTILAETRDLLINKLIK